MKFIEKSGYLLQNQLEKADPFHGGTCYRPDCFPCEHEDGGDCESRGCGYEITCEEEDCRAHAPRYDGESGRNGYTRGLEHMKGYRSGKKDNAMKKHADENHEGRKDVRYKMRVVRTFKRDNVRRKLFEAVRIVRNEGLRMNSKSEYRQAVLPLIEIHRGPLDRDQ